MTRWCVSTVCSNLGLCLAALLIGVFAIEAHAQSELRRSETKDPVSQTFTEAGIAVKFSVEPVAAAPGRKFELREETDAIVRFEITETATNKPLVNLRPTAWISLKRNRNALDPKSCREKIQSLLQANFTE